MKLPFFKRYPSDYLVETRRLPHLANSVFNITESNAWNEPERGVYKRSLAEFCREINLTEIEALGVLENLMSVVSVTLSNKIVTLKFQQMIDLERRYKLHANRQSRYRSKLKSDARVTLQTLDVRCQTTSEHLTSSPSVGFPSSLPLASPSPAPSPSFRAKAPAPAPLATTSPKAASETSTPALTKTEVYLPWEMPEEERMTPEEMVAIKRKNLGPRPKH